MPAKNQNNSDSRNDSPIDTYYNEKLEGQKKEVKPQDNEESERSGIDSLKDSEKKAESSDYQKPDQDNEGSLYNQSSEKPSRFSIRSLTSSRRRTAAMAAGGGAIGLVLIVTALLGLFSSFKLDFLMSNLEARGFLRYQVSMDARSSKWINAYMSARMMEVDNPRIDITKGDQPDNILFRSDRVDTNNPFIDWYKTLRTSNFESDVFEKTGIKFTSVAYQDGNSIKFRPGVIDINGKNVPLDLPDSVYTSIQNGDMNVFNTKVRDYIDVKVFDNDKDARRVIKKVVKDNTHWWQFIKRYHLRKNIQNMTGVRNWRFFERTRDNYNEKTVNIRNKLIVSVLPESTKTGKFINCFFGTVKCPNTSDVNSPDNRSTVTTTIGDRDGADGKTSEPDADGRTQSIDSSNGGDTVDAFKPDVTPGDNGPFYKYFIKQIASKLNIATGLISFIDTIYRLDLFISSGALVKIVIAAKAAQVVGVFQTFTTARDQAKTGELTAQEFNSFMGLLKNITNNEGWQTAVMGNKLNTVAAEGDPNVFTEAKNREEYCSAEHQEQIRNLAFSKQAEQEYHYLCPSDKVGAATNADTITNWWNNITEIFLVKDALTAYAKLGFATIYEWLGNAADFLVDKLGLDSLMQGFLAFTGLDQKIEQLSAWIGAKLLAALGGGPMLTGTEPAGVMVNFMVQGAGVSAESSARQQGGIAATAQTKAYNLQLATEYFEDYQNSKTNYEKYFALNDIDSTASKALFSYIENVDTTDTTALATGLLRNAAIKPLAMLSGEAKAAQFNSNPYSLADFAGYEHFDIPQQCIEMDILGAQPWDYTNADEKGLINKEDITWDLVRNNNAFWDAIYPKIYELAPDDPDSLAFTVYNCATVDSTVSGGLGRMYGYEDDFGYSNEPVITYDQPTSTTCEAGIGSDEIYWPTDPHPHTNSHDITVPVGTKVYAMSGGKVVESKDLKGCDGRICSEGYYSYGRYIKIDHGKYGVVTYAHLSERLVNVGDLVAPGQLIALSGDTGNSTGPHLHIDVNGSETLIPWLESHNALTPPNPICEQQANAKSDIRKRFEYTVQNPRLIYV